MSVLDPTDFVSADEWLTAVVQSSDDAIYSKDAQLLIRSWNPAAERLYGYTAAEAIGSPVRIIIPDDRAGEEAEIAARIFRGEKVDHYETRRRRKRSLVDVALTVSPLRAPDGSIVGASVIARDISERFRAEQLAREVEKLEFVNLVAHELKNPLVAIAAAAELLAATKEQLDPDIQRVVDIVVRQARISERLIRDLLILSHLNSGRFEVDLQDVDARQVVIDSIALASPPEGKEVSIVCEDGLPVVADPTRLRQVVVNLLTNAYKYGGDNITIEVRPGAGRAQIVVADDGPGLPETFEDKAFDSFARAPGATRGGSGLGLAIARGLVAAQRGTLRYERSRGARFVIELPSP